MKKFSYRFESLQGVRGIELDNLRMEMNSAQRSLEDAERELIRMRHELDSSYDEIARLRASHVGQVLQESLSGYGSLLKHRLIEQAGLIEKRRHELELARGRVREKHMETRVLEKHRDRQFELHLMELERSMQREMDESAGNIAPQED